MEDTALVEIAIGGVAHRGNVIPYNQLPVYVANKHKTTFKKGTEFYRSLFIYDNTFNGKIKEYTGTFDIDEIVLDVDCKLGELSLEPVKEIVDFLVKELDDNFDIWFSGTGFHMHLPDLFHIGKHIDLPNIMRLSVDKAVGKFGVDNIYDRARLIRTKYSYNIKNHTYKIPVSIDMLDEFTYNDFIEHAQNPNVYIGQRDPQKLIQPRKSDEPLWEKYIVMGKSNQISTSKPKDSTKSELTAHVTCVQKMFAQGPVQGKRHQTILRMASAWKRSGIPREGTESLIHKWSPSFDISETKSMLDTIYGWEHDGYGCQDSLMDSFCDSKCKFYKHKDYGVEIFNADTMTQQFQDFVEAEDDSNSFDLNDFYNIGSSYKFTIGELITMIGDTKLGKTAFIQNLVVRANQFKCLYLSLEVNQLLMWRRFNQIAFDISKQDVVDKYKSNDKEFFKEANEKLGHIKLMTVSPELNNIIDVISNLQPKILVIDTIDEIRVDYTNDSLVKMQRIVSKLKEIAQKYEIMIFVVSHISKSAAFERNLTRHSAKGDSSIEQKSDKLLGIYAPDPNGKARVVESIVARDESSFKLRCYFNHETFRFKQAV